MSTIGGGLPVSPLVSSTAGAAAQQRSAQANQAAQESTAKANQAQQAAVRQMQVGDVGESSQTADRDADGREAWRWSTPRQAGEVNSPPVTSELAEDEEGPGQAINFQA